MFKEIGGAFNAPVSTDELLRLIAMTLVKRLKLKGATIRLLSRDGTALELVAAYGVSERFLSKGPLDAESSVGPALEGKTVFVPDCASDPRIQHPEAYVEEGIVSVLTLPLVSRGQVIGVLRLGSSERREYSPQELQILDAAASFCSSAILRSLFDGILKRVAETIRSSLDLKVRLTSITEVVTSELRAKGCAIQLLDPRTGKLELQAACGLNEAYLRTVAADPAAGAVAEALQGECAQIVDARNDPRVKYQNEVTREKVGSILYVPLTVRGKTIGVLRLYTHRPYQFSENELHLMRAIGGECALAIQNAQMYAVLNERYEGLVEDFHRWFEHDTSPRPHSGAV